MCASVTSHNLVPVKGRWCPTAGKVTGGLASHWFIHLRAHGLRKGDEHPGCTPRGMWHSFTVFFSLWCHLLQRSQFTLRHRHNIVVFAICQNLFYCLCLNAVTNRLLTAERQCNALAKLMSDWLFRASQLLNLACTSSNIMHSAYTISLHFSFYGSLSCSLSLRQWCSPRRSCFASRQFSACLSLCSASAARCLGLASVSNQGPRPRLRLVIVVSALARTAKFPARYWLCLDRHGSRLRH